MQVNIEESSEDGVSKLWRKLTVQIPAERIEKEFANKLRDTSRNVRIDGFRPGKVPVKVVEKRFGKDIRQEVIGEMVQSSFHEALVQEKVNPAGYPEVDVNDKGSDTGVELVATFEVYPEIELQPFSDLTVEMATVEIQESDIDTMIEKIREQQKEWADSDKAAENGDQVTMGFVGKIDGEVFPNGSASDFPIVLGEGNMIPGFEDGLLGMKKGDEKTIEVTFPEDYNAKELAGKPATFDLSVSKVAQAKLPEVNSEFTQKFGIAKEDSEEEMIKKLREQVKDNMQRELKQSILNNTKKSVIDAMLEKIEFEVPTALVEEESKRLLEQTKQYLGEAATGGDLKAEQFSDEATHRVKVGLLFGVIVNQRGLLPEQDKVRARVEEIASTYQDPQEVIQWYFADNERIEGVESAVLEDQVVELVVSEANVTEKESSFEEIMQPVMGEG